MASTATLPRLRRGKGARAAAEPQVLVETRHERANDGWEAPALLAITIALLGFGIVTVYSASAVKAQSAGLADSYFVVRQATGGAVGLLLLVLAANVDYRRLRLAAWPLLLLIIGLLVLTVAPGTQSIAPVINGARRWLFFGPIALQPVELAKFAVIVWTAALAVKKQDRLGSLSRGLLPFLTVWGIIVGLVFLQPNLSSAALIVLLAALVVFAAGARIGHFILLAFVALPVLWATIDGVAYRMRRLTTFLDPTHDPAGMSYQINQALIALGSGGLFGRGFGHGQQKYGFLPEPHNDFIFAMIGEEWGFLGVLGILLLFCGILLIGYRVARNAPDLFGFLLAIGLTNLIAVQALLHMAVNTALIPTTGVTLPFISYGRSSLLVCLASVGVLINIARHGERRAE
jgi:cell division protein FtsW